MTQLHRIIPPQAKAAAFASFKARPARPYQRYRSDGSRETLDEMRERRWRPLPVDDLITAARLVRRMELLGVG